MYTEGESTTRNETWTRQAEDIRREGENQTGGYLFIAGRLGGRNGYSTYNEAEGLLLPGTAVCKGNAGRDGLENVPVRHECDALAEAKRENHKTQRSKANGCLEGGRMPMFAKAAAAFNRLIRSSCGTAKVNGQNTRPVRLRRGQVHTWRCDRRAEDGQLRHRIGQLRSLSASRTASHPLRQGHACQALPQVKCFGE